MKRCPHCLSTTIVKGRCTHCHFIDRRKVHTMLNPQLERRGRVQTGWDRASIKEKK